MGYFPFRTVIKPGEQEPLHYWTIEWSHLSLLAQKYCYMKMHSCKREYQKFVLDILGALKGSEA